MLHKCVASNRCCPKLHEESLGLDPENASHLYSNPYLQEDPRIINATLGEEGGPDFPAHAMALMYDPTCAQAEEQQSESEDEEEGLSVGNESIGLVENVDDFMSMPKLVTASPPTRIPSSLGGALRAIEPSSALVPGLGGRRASSSPSLPVPQPPSLTTAWDIGEEGGGVDHARSSSSPRPAAPSTLRPLPAAKNTQAGGSSGSKAQPLAEFASPPRGHEEAKGETGMPLQGKAAKSAASHSGLGHFEPASGITLDRSFPGPGSVAAGRGRPSSARTMVQDSSQTAVRMPPLASSTASPSPEQGSQVHRQQKTLSRSLREAKACKSAAGAASIAAIMQVVAQSQEASGTPLAPGHAHWHHQRWTDCAAERQLVSGH